MPQLTSRLVRESPAPVRSCASRAGQPRPQDRKRGAWGRSVPDSAQTMKPRGLAGAAACSSSDPFARQPGKPSSETGGYARPPFQGPPQDAARSTRRACAPRGGGFHPPCRSTWDASRLIQRPRPQWPLAARACGLLGETAGSRISDRIRPLDRPWHQPQRGRKPPRRCWPESS